MIGSVFDSTLIDERPGIVVVLFEGTGAKELFKDEAGGHRWQRVPPTEKRGRMQTSTVTVAVLAPEDSSVSKLDLNEVEITTARGTGPGGQHRNKTESCVVAKHLPTGISVRIDAKSQHQSKKIALQILESRIQEVQLTATKKEQSKKRKQQVGTGMRGDKIRTYRQQDDRVVDHRTNKKWRLSKWVRGEW